ncbi:MAG: hypothetical protein RLY87_2450 [Chloroflexota bacterium]|jgi:predicted N-acetyltransferase YhbS
MYQIHGYRDAADFAAMQKLASRLWLQQAPYAYMLPGDLAWWRAATPDDSSIHSAELWRCGDDLVGFTWRVDGDVDFLADTAIPGLVQEMLTHIAATTPSEGVVWAFGRHTDRTTILEALGYTRGEAGFRMHLMDPRNATAVPLPPDWHVEKLAPTLSATTERAAAQRSAFQSTKMTTERYAFARTLPGYSPEWDMVLRDPAGTIISFVTIWVDAATQTALFEPVGCIHVYKRQGWARRLLCTALVKLAEAGITTASVLSDPPSAAHPAGWLYESCGFHPIDTLYQWNRVQK